MRIEARVWGVSFAQGEAFSGNRHRGLELIVIKGLWGLALI